MPRPEHPQTTELPPLLAEGPAADMYRWLAENGITEWLPERATIMINAELKAITYPSYKWIDDQRGFNSDYLAPPAGDGQEHGQPITPRIVRLETPLTDEARQSAEATRQAGLGEIRFVEI